MSHFFFPQKPVVLKASLCLFPPQVWSRKAEGRFPEAKELKQRVRDVLVPKPTPGVGPFFFFGNGSVGYRLPLVWVKGVYILKLGTLAICWCFFAHILNKEDSLRGFGIAQRSEHVITVTYGEQLRNMFHPVKQAYYSYLSEVWLSLTDLNWGAVYVSL